MVRLIITPIVLLFLSTQGYAADCGQFKVVKGKVIYKQKGHKKFKKARINKKVCQGDMVKTQIDSRAKIIMADQNEINISPQTELFIEVYEKNKKAVLNVLNGKVRSNVKKKYDDDEDSHYRVKTKSAVAGVRGTEFLASFSRQTNESKVVTFEGIVKVGRIEGGKLVGSVMVRPGQFTSNRMGQNPHTPREVPAKELSMIEQDSNVADAPRDVSSDGGSARGADSVNSNDDQPSDTSNTSEAPDAIDSKNNNRQPNSTGGRNELPPPELPKDVGGIVKTPPAPPTFDPTLRLPINNVCQTCNDAIINKKVKVIVVPKYPGQK